MASNIVISPKYPYFKVGVRYPENKDHSMSRLTKATGGKKRKHLQKVADFTTFRKKLLP
jgi:hypothetical protein